MSGRLDGKVALISGAARGMGAAHAERFVDEGAAVVMGDIRDDEGRALAERLSGEERRAIYVHLDVRRDADWEAAVAAAEERFGKLDVLVNNAGLLSMPDVLEMTDDHWNDVIATNQTGVLRGMRAAIPALKRAGGGSIINIASIWGMAGAAGNVAYQASKGAVVQMTRSAALTYVGDGIRANSVCPGLVLTAMLDEEGPESVAAVTAATPMGRSAAPEEISPALVFLASDEASFITGSELVIDGGYLAQ
jgi:3alpha(or 20beta)-hydroxysteroid dehydrogenase